jgi:DNA-binding XRE family transcriptional regulator
MCVGLVCHGTFHTWVLAYVFCTWYVTYVAGKAQVPNVGARIKEARDLLGLSQMALAAKLDQGERTVQAWERNERHPRLDSLTRLAALADRPVSWFYADHDPDLEPAA